ncbi:hypothetical protein ARMSODRAFT_1018267 [Armillaria solidipes]|uniref:Uncharacterized protein n=1 Tax=Armillaria solidipes TaxID=1076256 RepID=A0A2H3C019_9AGAR|nr:hypothetical protein ARMSODRAFT_1018267 [Armillaria solidipes]
MASYPSEFTLQNRSAMLKVTSFESLLYGIHATLRVFMIWIVVTRDRGRSRLVRCGLVIMMYLIATSPLAIRSMFVEGIRHDETQETIYIYTPGWMPLSSTAFMVNILITDCMVFDGGYYGLDLAVLVPLWSLMDVCRHSWTVHHCWNKFVPFIIIVVKLEVTSNPVFAGFGLYEMTTMSPSGNACTAHIDWMLPYYSMSLAITMLCTFVILCRIVMGPRVGGRTCRLWINVIVESSLLFAAGPIILLVTYITSDMHTSCPLLAVTMSTGLAPILAIARVPSNATMQESPPLVPFEVQDNVA